MHRDRTSQCLLYARKIKDINLSVSILFLLGVSILIYLYGNTTPLSEDEVWYTYVIECERSGRPYNEPDSLSRSVDSFSDLYISQLDHWKTMSGRTVPHTIEQLFPNILPLPVFYVLNSLVFALTIISIIYLTVKNKFFNIWCFIISVIVLVYLPPEPINIITSINRAPNYLWSMLLSTVFLIIIGIKRNIYYKHWWLYIPVALISIIAGWSHEAFAVPIAIALILSSLINKNKKAKKWQIVLLAIYLIGTFLVVFSPGTLLKANKEDGAQTLLSIYGIIFRIEHCFYWWTTYAILGIIIYVKIKYRRHLKNYFENNIFWIATIVVSYCVSFLFFGGRANVAVSYFILLYSLHEFSQYMPQYLTPKNLILPSVICLIIICHLTLVVKAQKYANKVVEKTLSEFLESEDGIVAKRDLHLPALIKPFVRYDYSLNNRSWAFEYFQWKKIPFFMEEDTYYEFEKSTGSLDDTSLYPGGTNFHRYGNSSIVWAPAKDVEEKQFVWNYAPASFFDPNIDFSSRMKRLFFSSRCPLQEDAGQPQIMHTRWGEYAYYVIPPAHTVTSLEEKD